MREKIVRRNLWRELFACPRGTWAMENIKILYKEKAKWRSMGRAMIRKSHNNLSIRGGIVKFMELRKQKIGKW